MRVLFTMSAWPTHYFAMVPVAWAFRGAGHEVRVACQPSMADTVMRSGQAAVPVGPDVDYLAIRKRTLAYELSDDEKPQTEEEWAKILEQDGPKNVFAAWQEATMSNIDDLVALAREWQPDLIVSDTMSPGGLVAARATGVPGLRHLWAPDILGSTEGERIMPMLPGFREPYERYGLEFDGDPASATIDPCPPSMQPPPAPTRMQVRWTPYNGPGLVPGWVLDQPALPRVCVTWGTSTAGTTGKDGFLVPRVVRALSDLDVEIVVAVGGADQDLLGELPGRVRVVEGLPLHALMPTCDLIVHQGGASTMLTAAYHGVRQLAISHLPEQVKDAAALASTGAGVQVPRDEADADSIRVSAARLLHAPEFRAAAERLRAEIHHQPTPAELVTTLDRLFSPDREPLAAGRR